MITTCTRPRVIHAKEFPISLTLVFRATKNFDFQNQLPEENRDSPPLKVFGEILFLSERVCNPFLSFY